MMLGEELVSREVVQVTGVSLEEKLK